MVKRKATQWLCVLALAGSASVVGCSVDSADSAQESYGSVAMALSSTSSTGAIYRLHNAQFDLQGPQATVLASSDDPNETQLSATLPTGPYTSRLLPGW